MNNPELPKLPDETIHEINLIGGKILPSYEFSANDEDELNRQELMLGSPGFRLSMFMPGANLFVKFVTEDDESQFMMLRLKLWPNSTEIKTDEAVRAEVLESSFQKEDFEGNDLMIHGASISDSALFSPHRGEIRKNCNLLATIIELVDRSDVSYNQDKGLVDFCKQAGRYEISTSGKTEGKLVELNIGQQPRVLPEVVNARLIVPEIDDAVLIKWQDLQE